jgi:predicted DNA-binding transcriptional regulator AlpA
MPAPVQAPIYLSAAQVKARYGHVSDMWLWRRLRHDNFPKPFRMSSGGSRARRLFKLVEIEAWEAERIKRAGAAA